MGIDVWEAQQHWDDPNSPADDTSNTVFENSDRIEFQIAFRDSDDLWCFLPYVRQIKWKFGFSINPPVQASLVKHVGFSNVFRVCSLSNRLCLQTKHSACEQALELCVLEMVNRVTLERYPPSSLESYHVDIVGFLDAAGGRLGFTAFDSL